MRIVRPGRALLDLRVGYHQEPLTERVTCVLRRYATAQAEACGSVMLDGLSFTVCRIRRYADVCSASNG